MHSLPYHHFSGVRVRFLIHPMELFLSYQDRPDALVVILGHISLLLALEMIVFSQICYGLHYSTEGCLFTLLCHCFIDFCRDEPPKEHDFRVLIIPPSMTLQ